MSLESPVNFISDLNIANPSGPTDPKSQGDDHIRNIKKALKATFPNINGAMTATDEQLNQLATANPAITLPVGTKMIFAQAAAPTGWTKDTANDNAALRLVSGAGGGTGGTANFTTAFASRTPTGANSDVSLSTAQIPVHAHTQQGSFASGFVSSDHSHSVSINSGTQSANHAHSIFGPIIGNMAHDSSSEGDFGVGGGFTHGSSGENVTHFHGVSGNTGGISANHQHTTTISGATANAGSGATHTHTFTGVAMDFAVKYVDVIICSKS